VKFHKIILYGIISLATIGISLEFIGCKKKHRHRDEGRSLTIIRPGPDFLGTTGRRYDFEASAIGIDDPLVAWDVKGTRQAMGTHVTLELPEGSYDVIARSSGLEARVHVVVNDKQKYVISGREIGKLNDLYIVDEAFNTYNITRTDDVGESAFDVSSDGKIIVFGYENGSRIFTSYIDGSYRAQAGFIDGKNPRFEPGLMSIIYTSNSPDPEVHRFDIMTSSDTPLAQSIVCLRNTNICWASLTNPIPTRSGNSAWIYFAGREVSAISSQQVIIKLDPVSLQVTTPNQPASYDINPTDINGDRIIVNAIPRNSGPFEQVMILETANGILHSVSPIGTSNVSYRNGAFSHDGTRIAYIERKAGGQKVALKVFNTGTSGEASVSIGDVPVLESVRFLPP